MESFRSVESYRNITRRHNPEELEFNLHRRERLISRILNESYLI